MERYTIKQLKSLVSSGACIDISSYSDDAIFTLKRQYPLKQIGYSIGQYGCNGMLIHNETTHQLYCIIGRKSVLWLF